MTDQTDQADQAAAPAGMTRDEYLEVMRQVWDANHAVYWIISAAQDRFSSDTEEWRYLHQLGKLADVAGDYAYRMMYPRPCGITDGEPGRECAPDGE